MCVCVFLCVFEVTRGKGSAGFTWHSNSAAVVQEDGVKASELECVNVRMRDSETEAVCVCVCVFDGRQGDPDATEFKKTARFCTQRDSMHREPNDDTKFALT